MILYGVRSFNFYLSMLLDQPSGLKCLTTCGSRISSNVRVETVRCIHGLAEPLDLPYSISNFGYTVQFPVLSPSGQKDQQDNCGCAHRALRWKWNRRHTGNNLIVYPDICRCCRFLKIIRHDSVHCNYRLVLPKDVLSWFWNNMKLFRSFSPFRLYQ